MIEKKAPKITVLPNNKNPLTNTKNISFPSYSFHSYYCSPLLPPTLVEYRFQTVSTVMQATRTKHLLDPQ